MQAGAASQGLSVRTISVSIHGLGRNWFDQDRLVLDGPVILIFVQRSKTGKRRTRRAQSVLGSFHPGHRTRHQIGWTWTSGRLWRLIGHMATCLPAPKASGENRVKRVQMDGWGGGQAPDLFF